MSPYWAISIDLDQSPAKLESVMLTYPYWMLHEHRGSKLAAVVPQKQLSIHIAVDLRVDSGHRYIRNLQMTFPRAADLHSLVFAHGQNVDHFNLLHRYGFKNNCFKAERNDVFNQIDRLIILSRKVHSPKL